MTESELEQRISERLAREPVVVVSTFETWLRWTFIVLLVIDLLLTGWLLSQVERNYTFLGEVGEMINEAKALDCRGLVLDGQVLDPNGSCYHPEVLRYYDPLTGQSR